LSETEEVCVSEPLVAVIVIVEVVEGRELPHPERADVT
jgi:hypothetical protein